MTTMLPPARDLPPGRQQAIRTALERSVVRRRRGMRLATVATALAAAAAVVVMILPGQPSRGYWSTRPAMIPGLTAEQVEDIEEGCWKSARIKDRPTLYRYYQDAAGAGALLYTRGDSIECDLSTPGAFYSGWQNRGKGYDTRWLTGHFSVDMWGQRAGDPIRNIPGLSQTGGRVDSQVARMTWTLDGVTVDAEILNGTFVARILYASNWQNPKKTDPEESLKAYDAEGNLIGNSRDALGKCFVDWEGNIITGVTDPQDPDTCAPALPWR